MNSYRRWWQAFLAAVPLVGMLTIWILFAPVQLDGQTTYVIVNGSSMEPNYHFGDLAVLRQAVDYQVGDVVAY
ncbi:MAG TPA: S24/S26 family peptidase, partial [Anaerolineales bacterium]|nr:S24/S26 family peptidase [Anaerolineales bacterium]